MAITAKDLEFIGVQHNEIVDKTYYALYESKINGQESQQFVCDFLVDTILNLPDYTEQSNTIGAVYAGQNILVPIVDFETLYTGQPAKMLTDREKTYLDLLYNIIKDYNDDHEKTYSEITELENKISDDNFDKKQLITLFSATNLGKFSLEYWINNEEKWSSLSSNPIKSGRRHAEDIAIADAAGAVGGAAGAWIVNIVPALGQAAYGSAIVGTAVAGSVTAGIVKLLDWWRS